MAGEDSEFDCGTCGKKLRLRAAFCVHCGARIPDDLREQIGYTPRPPMSEAELEALRKDKRFRPPTGSHRTWRCGAFVEEFGRRVDEPDED
jgi:hypothetical protein